VVAEELIQTWKKAVEASNQLFPVLEDLFREHLGIKHVDA
jgi:hypothetical protein